MDSLNQIYHPLYNPYRLPNNTSGGTGMINTIMQPLAPHHQPQFLSTVLTRYPTGSVKVSPIVDLANSADINQTTIAQRFTTSYYPTLKLVEDMLPCSPRQTTTIKVDSTKHILPNDQFVVVPFGEMIRVVQVTGDHTLDVVRGVGTVVPFGAKRGFNLQYAGNAFREASLRPLGKFHDDGVFWTQTQIFRDGWAVTETEHAVSVANGNNTTQKSRKDAALAHSLAIEMALLFGQHGSMIHQGQPLRTFSGLLDIIRLNAPQNIITTSGRLNYFDLIDMFDGFADVSVGSMPSMTRLIYCDREFNRTFIEIGLKYAQLQFMQAGTDSFGQRFSKFITPRLNFEIREHPIFQMLNMPAGMAFVIDMPTLKLHYLRRTRVAYFNASDTGSVQTFTTDNGIDARGGDFLTECTVTCDNPAACGVIYGFKGGEKTYGH